MAASDRSSKHSAIVVWSVGLITNVKAASERQKQWAQLPNGERITNSKTEVMPSQDWKKYEKEANELTKHTSWNQKMWAQIKKLGDSPVSKINRQWNDYLEVDLLHTEFVGLVLKLLAHHNIHSVLLPNKKDANARFEFKEVLVEKFNASFGADRTYLLFEESDQLDRVIEDQNKKLVSQFNTATEFLQVDPELNEHYPKSASDIISNADFLIKMLGNLKQGAQTILNEYPHACVRNLTSAQFLPKNQIHFLVNDKNIGNKLNDYPHIVASDEKLIADRIPVYLLRVLFTVLVPTIGLKQLYQDIKEVSKNSRVGDELIQAINSYIMDKNSRGLNNNENDLVKSLQKVRQSSHDAGTIIRYAEDGLLISTLIKTNIVEKNIALLEVSMIKHAQLFLSVLREAKNDDEKLLVLCNVLATTGDDLKRIQENIFKCAGFLTIDAMKDKLRRLITNVPLSSLNASSICILLNLSADKVVQSAKDESEPRKFWNQFAEINCKKLKSNFFALKRSHLLDIDTRLAEIKEIFVKLLSEKIPNEDDPLFIYKNLMAFVESPFQKRVILRVLFDQCKDERLLQLICKELNFQSRAEAIFRLDETIAQDIKTRLAQSKETMIDKIAVTLKNIKDIKKNDKQELKEAVIWQLSLLIEQGKEFPHKDYIRPLLNLSLLDASMVNEARQQNFVATKLKLMESLDVKIQELFSFKF